MKNALIIFFSFLICNVSLAQKINSKPVQQKANYVKPIDRSLLVKKDSLYYNAKGDSLFTGNCVDYWPNKNIKTTYHYKNGKLDSWLGRYDENGRMTARECYKDGKPFGVWTKQ